MPETNSKGKFELTVDLIKAISWPLFAAVVLASFWGPLHSAATQLPNIVSRSETLTIAGLSLKIGKGISRQPSQKVKQTISESSPDGIQRLLNTSGSIWWDVGDETRGKAEYAELVRLGLMEEVPKKRLRNEQSKKQYGYAVELTSLGKEAQNFLFAIVSEFVQELGKANDGALAKE